MTGLYKPRRAAALVAALGLAAVLAACSSSSNSSSSTGSSASSSASASTGASLSAQGGGSLPGSVAADGTVTPPTLQTTPPAGAQQALAKYVPAALRPYYANYWTYAKLGPDPYAGWKAPKGPYKFCESETFLGNAFRQGTLQGLQQIVANLQKQGIASGPLTVLNANGNITVHASQINQLVNEGCNVIWSLTAGPTGICPAVANARAHNVLFMTIETPVDCPDAMNIDFNEPYAGLTTATALVHLLHGKGNILELTGIPGIRISSARLLAANAVFAQAPGMHIVGTAEGEYALSTAKSAVLQFLATHPGKIDGVWDAGAMALGAAEAFQQDGRPEPVIDNFAGDCAFLAYWHDHNLQSFSVDQGPHTAVYEAWVITKRMLAGQEPSANLILYPLSQITQSTLNNVWQPSMTVNSTCFAESPNLRAVPDSFFNPLFTH